jgi:hypothetical protein
LILAAAVARIKSFPKQPHVRDVLCRSENVAGARLIFALESNPQ